MGEFHIHICGFGTGQAGDLNSVTKRDNRAILKKNGVPSTCGSQNKIGCTGFLTETKGYCCPGKCNTAIVIEDVKRGFALGEFDIDCVCKCHKWYNGGN